MDTINDWKIREQNESDAAVHSAQKFSKLNNSDMLGHYFVKSYTSIIYLTFILSL